MAESPLLSNITMTGTLARMLDRIADFIGAQTTGTIAAHSAEFIALRRASGAVGQPGDGNEQDRAQR